MTDPRTPSTAADHATHDLVLVAEAADRGGRLPAAQASCPDCLALHADLVLLAAAMPDAALPARPRDYTLSEADAARLRPAGWRRWLAAIGTSRDAVTRPLAVGLTTIGLAGLLVASVPGILPFGSASSGAAPAPADTTVAGEAAAAPSAGTSMMLAVPSAAPAAAAAPVAAATANVSAEQPGLDKSAAPSGEADQVFSGGDDATSAASGQTQRQLAAPSADVAVRDDASGVSVLFVVAGALLIVGLGLFGLRWSARRG